MNISSIKKIKDFETLTRFLTNELQWPFPDYEDINIEDVTFDYSPEEIGLSDEFATKVRSIKQIQPLDKNQPWSIFWIDFDNKKLPITVLRRILSVFVRKKRPNLRNLATKALDEIMFVTSNGAGNNKVITFALFKKLDEMEVIREFYWDNNETEFGNISCCLESLTWPDNTNDITAWKENWKVAFTGSTREAISTSDQLARGMARLAKNIRVKVLEVLSIEKANGPVHKLYDTFKEGLVHDMTEQGFADMYAQTITYGLFSARTMDIDGHFELKEVIDLIPQTNPFLKNLFKECLEAGDKKHKIDLDELGIGELVELFDRLNRSDGNDTMKRILAEFGRQFGGGSEDPVIHFYEGFLSEYDKSQKVERGVFYTPDPVVSFIVRSVNEQLKSEFGLEMGLADTTTWAEMVNTGRAEFPVDPKTGKQNNEWREKIKGRAFVQILDPATGTGTFLKHVIEIIHEEVKAKYKHDNTKSNWIDYWNNYVFKNLLPRIYGFELMMASYSVAHMNIGMYLKSLGYKFEKEQRLNIFLTNSLEPYNTGIQANFFFNSIGAEALAANNVKQNRYFSVVIGNPPYFGFRSNSGDWIKKLIDEYKLIDGVDIAEKKHRLGNDYVKFLRYAQYQITKNGKGILAFINDHGFLFNPTFRGMRWNLLKSFDQIYILDLHGNSKKKERSNDGSKDENVFDIQQGVSINIFLHKKPLVPRLATVFYHDLSGLREKKYFYLREKSIYSDTYKVTNPTKPFYFFLPSKATSSVAYDEGFLISELFEIGVTGTLSGNDSLLIADNEDVLFEKLNTVTKTKIDRKFIKTIDYRPFDKKAMFYISTFKNNPYPKIHVPASYRSRNDVMQHLTDRKNFCLIVGRQGQVVGDMPWNIAFIGNSIVDLNMFYRGGGVVSPLYRYENKKTYKSFEEKSCRVPNLNKVIVEKLEETLGLTFTGEKKKLERTFAPIDILDYIYAVLYSPTYRENYKEFLKIDFPRIPYPKNQAIFWDLVKLGTELRLVHLLESTPLKTQLANFSNKADNQVVKIEYKDLSVWINRSARFSDVPETAWSLYIGGYQPAQKWLKDRKGKSLTKDDINHYKKIIIALTQTDRIMKEINKIEI